MTHQLYCLYVWYIRPKITITLHNGPFVKLFEEVLMSRLHYCEHLTNASHMHFLGTIFLPSLTWKIKSVLKIFPIIFVKEFSQPFLYLRKRNYGTKILFLKILYLGSLLQSSSKVQIHTSFQTQIMIRELNCRESMFQSGEFSVQTLFSCVSAFSLSLFQRVDCTILLYNAPWSCWTPTTLIHTLCSHPTGIFFFPNRLHLTLMYIFPLLFSFIQK